MSVSTGVAARVQSNAGATFVVVAAGAAEAGDDGRATGSGAGCGLASGVAAGGGSAAVFGGSDGFSTAGAGSPRYRDRSPAVKPRDTRSAASFRITAGGSQSSVR